MQNLAIYREKPLSDDQFSALDRHARKCFSIERKMEGKSVPQRDYDGNIYAWEHDMVPSGYSLVKKSEPSEELIESLRRPAESRAIIVHLTRLAAHKKFTEGDAGWGIIQSDLCRFLEGCSEYAIRLAIENHILDRSSRWFPMTADLVADVKSIDDQLRIDAEKKPVIVPKREENPITVEERNRVGEMLAELANKLRSGILQKEEKTV